MSLELVPPLAEPEARRRYRSGLNVGLIVALAICVLAWLIFVEVALSIYRWVA